MGKKHSVWLDQGVERLPHVLKLFALELVGWGPAPCEGLLILRRAPIFVIVLALLVSLARTLPGRASLLVWCVVRARVSFAPAGCRCLGLCSRNLLGACSALSWLGARLPLCFPLWLGFAGRLWLSCTLLFLALLDSGLPRRGFRLGLPLWLGFGGCLWLGCAVLSFVFHGAGTPVGFRLGFRFWLGFCAVLSFVFHGAGTPVGFRLGFRLWLGFCAVLLPVFHGASLPLGFRLGFPLRLGFVGRLCFGFPSPPVLCFPFKLITVFVFPLLRFQRLLELKLVRTRSSCLAGVKQLEWDKTITWQIATVLPLWTTLKAVKQFCGNQK